MFCEALVPSVVEPLGREPSCALSTAASGAQGVLTLEWREGAVVDQAARSAYLTGGARALVL